MLFACEVKPIELNVVGLDVKEIQPKDEKLFLDFLMQSDYNRVSYYNSFYYMCALNLNKGNQVFLYCIVNDWLLTFEYNRKSEMYSIKNSPINRNGDYSDMQRIYRIYIGILSKLNADNGCQNSLYNVLIPDIETYLVKKNLHGCVKNYKEFIFRCSDLIELKGKEYKSRRHVVNKLKTDYPDVSVREYTSDDKESVRLIYNKWVEDYHVRLENEEVCNIGLVEHTFETLVDNSSHYRIFVATIDSKIEGFIVIVPLCKDTKCVLIEYTNLEIKGLAEFLWYEGLRNTQDIGTFENDGTGGKETDGLFFYKQSHRPIDFVETYECKLNKSKKMINKSIFKEQ